MKISKTYQMHGVRQCSTTFLLNGKLVKVLFRNGTSVPTMISAKYITTDRGLQAAIEKDKRYGDSITLYAEAEVPGDYDEDEEIVIVRRKSSDTPLKAEPQKSEAIPPVNPEVAIPMSDKTENKTDGKTEEPKTPAETPPGTPGASEVTDPIIPPVNPEVKDYPEVITVQAAKNILNIEYKVSLAKLANKPMVLSEAATNGVSFSNLK